MAIKLTFTMNPDGHGLAKQMGRRNYKQKLDEKLGELSKKINRNIQEEAPKKSGKLAKAHRQHKLKQNEYEGYVDARTKASKYYPLVIKGTAPHEIRPRVKKALFWPGLPHPIKYVKRHPGTKPNDYVKRGLDRSQGDIRKTQEEFAVGVQQELIGG